MLSDDEGVIYMWEYRKTKLAVLEVQLGQMCNWIVGGAIQVPSATSNPYLRVRAALLVRRNDEDEILISLQ
jgi:hypothetical protein